MYFHHSLTQSHFWIIRSWVWSAFDSEEDVEEVELQDLTNSYSAEASKEGLPKSLVVVLAFDQNFIVSEETSSVVAWISSPSEIVWIYQY